MAALARRSPRARLYSTVPRSSQCPSISTSWPAFALSQLAFSSRTFEASGLMLYRSKSKKMSLTLALTAKSLGAGRAVGAGVAGAAVGAGGGGAGAATMVSLTVSCTTTGAGAAGGGGADAWVMAGRFAQPAVAMTATRSETPRRFTTRVTMSPPWTMSGRSTARILSRQSGRPRRARVGSSANERILLGAVWEHREDLPAAQAARLERDVAPVG